MLINEDTLLMLYEIVDVVISGLTIGSVYALMAMGMTLVYGVTKAFNFAYGEFYNLAGFFAWILIIPLGFKLGGYFTVFMIVVPVMFIVGYGLEKALIAPLRKHEDWENKVMLLTLGLSLFLASLYMVVFGARMKTLPPFMEGVLEWGELVFAYQDIMIFVLSISSIFTFSWMLNNTRIGMAVRAVAQNPEGARIVGIPKERIFAVTFALSTAMVGFGGVLLSQKWFIDPGGGADVMIKAWVVTAFGGMGSIRGSLYAAFIIGMLEAFVGWIFGLSYGIIALFILLLATLVFRPRGLMGKGA
jgi:branched-chain amino acid transport system permease protein